MNWSTKLIDLYPKYNITEQRDSRISNVLGIDEEKWPITKPFYRNNPNLRARNISFDYTDDEKVEIIKLQDPLYFSNSMKFNGSIKLRSYQEEIINNYKNNRFNLIVSSRQTGSSLLNAIQILHYALANNDKYVLVISNKIQSSISILDKIKILYENMPYFSKCGVITYNNSEIKFDNGTTIRVGSPVLFLGRNIDFLVIDEFAHIPDKVINNFYASIIPVISAHKYSKISISSTPNGNNLFKKLVSENTNMFNKQLIHWSLTPGRNEKWKKDEINMIGLESFMREYELLFEGTKEWNRYLNLEKLV